MNIESFEKRQAITSWRDRFQLAVWDLANNAGIDARAALEAHLRDAGIQDSLWDPSHFAQECVDMPMQLSLKRGFEELLARAAAELGAISPSYEALCGCESG